MDPPCSTGNDFAYKDDFFQTTPDWAIAFQQGAVRHIFFVAETKGTLGSLELRGVEQAKIECARRLFNEISTDDVRYDQVDSWESLIAAVNGA